MNVTTIVLSVGFLATAAAGGAAPSATLSASEPASPILTSVTELATGFEPQDAFIELRAKGLTSTGQRATVVEEVPCWTEDEHHRKVTNPQDGYFIACYRVLFAHHRRTYIAGYEEVHGNSYYDEDDRRLVEVSVPFDFDIATQSFRIRTEEMLPLPLRFSQRVWADVRFLVPVNLRRFSKPDVEALIRARGGEIVGAEGPVDVVVLPDRVDFCPNSEGGRNRLAEHWIRRGTRVLWERHLGRPDASPVEDAEGNSRD